MVEQFSSFHNMVNQLITMEIVLDNELLSFLLLSSLPKSCETLVISLSNSAPNEKLTFNMVKNNFLNEETKRKSNSKVIFSAKSNALVVESRGRKMCRNS